MGESGYTPTYTYTYTHILIHTHTHITRTCTHTHMESMRETEAEGYPEMYLKPVAALFPYEIMTKPPGNK